MGRVVGGRWCVKGGGVVCSRSKDDYLPEYIYNILVLFSYDGCFPKQCQLLTSLVGGSTLDLCTRGQSWYKLLCQCTVYKGQGVIPKRGGHKARCGAKCIVIRVELLDSDIYCSGDFSYAITCLVNVLFQKSDELPYARKQGRLYIVRLRLW